MPAVLVIPILSARWRSALGTSGLKTRAKLRGPRDPDPVVRLAEPGEATFSVIVVVMQMFI